jgi:hypothetical protein
MTSYAPTFTGRWRGHYVAAGLSHTFQLRKVRGATNADIQNLAGTAGAIFQVWADKLPTDFVWTSAEWAAQDSEVFTPSAPPAFTTGVLSPTPATYTPIQKITATTFSGKAPGSKARFSMFGIIWEFSNVAGDSETLSYDGKVLGTEDSRVTDVVALTAGQLSAGSGQGAIFYNVATVKPNDHLLRLVRRGFIA